jgi:hypothetical protein
MDAISFQYPDFKRIFDCLAAGERVVSGMREARVIEVSESVLATFSPKFSAHGLLSIRYAIDRALL